MGMWTINTKPQEHIKFSEQELDEFTLVLANLVCNRGMTVPAIMTLEMVKPLSFVGASGLTFFSPILEAIMDPVKIEKFQAIIADRSRIEKLMVEIETLEQNKKDIKEGESREQR